MTTICILPLAQVHRVVFGLRDSPPGSSCAVERDASLQALDAPWMMPAGSMVGDVYGSGLIRVVQEQVMLRDFCSGGPT